MRGIGASTGRTAFFIFPVRDTPLETKVQDQEAGLTPRRIVAVLRAAAL